MREGAAGHDIDWMGRRPALRVAIRIRRALAVSFRVLAPSLAVAALPLALAPAAARAGAAAVTAAAHHEDARIHPWDRKRIWKRCCPCHSPCPPSEPV